ncbi:unnamed protein product [Closterium sp. Naga37s-1]|nr:unnamed protein product [Closterium sp. Naga37s-1]
MEEDLPRDFGKLSNLQQLHIRSCPIKKLPASFTALTSLQTLTIEYCSQLSSIAGSLDNLKRLKQLELTGCCMLTGPLNFLPRSLEIQRLPSNLGFDLPQLRQLRLHFTKGLTALPETITRLQHLTSLVIDHASQLASLPDGIEALSRLRILRLSHCSALQHLPSSLTRLTCLHELNAKGAGIRALPPNMAQLSRLRKLYLGGCKQLQALPESLTDLTMLWFMGIKGSDRAIDSVSDQQECRYHRMYDLRTDSAGQ